MFFTPIFKRSSPYYTVYKKKRCKVCKAFLCLQGENAEAAQRIKNIVGLPIIGFTLIAGAPLTRVFQGDSSLFSMAFVKALLIFVAIAVLCFLVGLYVVNFIYLKKNKNIGYLSLYPETTQNGIPL